MKRCLSVLAVIGLCLAGVASASVQQGDTELDFLGGFFTANGEDSGDDVDVLFLSAALGYFLTDNIQVQGAAMGAWLSNGEDLDVYAIGGRAKYHFMPTNQWVPYVGGQIFWGNAENGDDVDGTIWGPVLGLRYELNEYNDFFAEYQYLMFEGDLGDAVDDAHGIFLGIIHQFK